MTSGIRLTAARRFDAALFVLLLALVALAPLPLGSNHEWSWTLGALLAALLVLLWGFNRLLDPAVESRCLQPLAVLGFLIACGWAWVQQADWAPVAWQHPLWSMSGDVLGLSLPGRISLSPEDGRVALMRLLAYGLVFFLALQLGRERQRARAAFGWLAIAGLVYALFGLAVYWGGTDPEWLFGQRALSHDLRSTLVNRNHFATWQGLTLLCLVAWFYQSMARPAVKPYSVPEDREARVEQFVLKAWKPMAALLLMVTALVLTHSRGGFVAALAGTVVLLLILDRRVAARSMFSRVTVVTALAVASLAFYLTSELLLDRINRTDVTTEARLEIFGNVERAIGDNPLLGFGYGTFADGFRLYDRVEDTVQYDRAHNTWLENAFELGLPAALALYLALGGLALTCWKGVWRRHRDWAWPALGVAASVLVGLHALVDFSLQIPAVAFLYACIMGLACAQSCSSGHNSRPSG